MAITAASAYTRVMVTYTDTDIDRVIERIVGFYYEKTKHDIDLVLEAFDAIKVQVDKIPRMEQDLAELKSDVKVIKKVVTDTNKDLRNHNKRITKLEQAVFHA